MLCEMCQTNTVAKKIQFLLGNAIKEFQVCNQCAEKHGLHYPFAGMPGALSVMMLGQLVKSLAPETAEDDHALVCDTCGTTIGKFRKTGVLGCPHCYDSFKTIMTGLLTQIHGSSKHIGSRPAGRRKNVTECDLGELKKQLQLAIKNENFEKAAELRDLIRDVNSSSVQDDET
jgi:protein arginine kinase activator